MQPIVENIASFDYGEIYLYIPNNSEVYSDFFYSHISSKEFSSESLSILSAVLKTKNINFESLFPKEEGSIAVWGSVLYAIPYIKKYSIPLSNFIKALTDLDVAVFCSIESCREPIKTAVKYYLDPKIRIDSYEHSFMSNLFFDILASNNSFKFILRKEYIEWEFIKRMVLQPILIFGNVSSFISVLDTLNRNYIREDYYKFSKSVSTSLVALDFVRIQMINNKYDAPLWKKKNKLHNIFDFDDELKLLMNRGRRYKGKTRRWLNKIKPNLKYFSERRGFSEKIAKDSWERWMSVL